jgi:hypothetical protein
MRYMMFVVVDPDAAVEAGPSEDDLVTDGKLELRPFWVDED